MDCSAAYGLSFLASCVSIQTESLSSFLFIILFFTSSPACKSLPSFFVSFGQRRLTSRRYLMAAYSFIMSDESSKQAIATIDNEFYPLPTLKVNSSRDFFKIPQSSTRADWTGWSVSHSNNDALYSFKINKIGDNTFIYKHGWSHIILKCLVQSVLFVKVIQVIVVYIYIIHILLFF